MPDDLRQGWECPRCLLVLAPDVREHRCDPPGAVPAAPPVVPPAGPLAAGLKRELADMDRQMREIASAMAGGLGRASSMPVPTVVHVSGTVVGTGALAQLFAQAWSA